MGVKVTCQETVRIGDVTSSGLGLNVSVLVNSGLEGRMKYAPIPDAGGVPGAQVLELGLAAIKRPLNIFRFRYVSLMDNGPRVCVCWGRGRGECVCVCVCVMLYCFVCVFVCVCVCE